MKVSASVLGKSVKCDRHLSNVISLNKTQFINILTHTLREGQVLVIVDGNIVKMSQAVKSLVWKI